VQRTICVVLVAVVLTGTAGVAAATDSIDQNVTAQSDQGCEFPISETDATDTEVTLDSEPESVVTLNPSAAQMLWEMGAQEKVTGVTKHATNLDGADQRTNISSAGPTIGHEIVVDLEPDLVLAPLSQVTTSEDVEILREAGLTVYAYPSAESVEGVRERTLLTGRLVGACDGAQETVDRMDEQISIVENAVEGESRPDVLYTFFGFTAGEATFIHEIIEIAGGRNVAAEAGIEEYQEVNEEIVVAEDPDWIVLNTDSPTVPDSEGFQRTTAVRENQTVVVDTNHLNRPGPRIVRAITTLAETFHPDAYEEAVAAAEPTPTEQPTTPTQEATEQPETPTEQPTESETPAPTETPEETDGTDEADDDGAGFGILAAAGTLLAFLAGGLVRRRLRRSD
jgi:iron complex transport system substrate-binding protein